MDRRSERRGLPVITNAVDACSVLTEPYVIALFERHGVMSRDELAAREEVGYEYYAKAINIEARTMIDMAKKQIIPAVVSAAAEVARSVTALDQAGVDASVPKMLLHQITTSLSEMSDAVLNLEEATNRAVRIRNAKEQAIAYRDTVRARFDLVRRPADKLETLIDSRLWPFPTYADLLFNV